MPRTVLIIVLLCGCVVPAPSQWMESRRVASGGGGRAAGDRFSVHGTLGQPAVGHVRNALRFADLGFWHPHVTQAAGSPAPERFALLQNFPNPSSATTTIMFDLPAPESVRLRVYDLLGRVVHEEERRDLPAGRQGIAVAVGHLAQGVYIYELRTSSRIAQRRMVVLR